MGIVTLALMLTGCLPLGVAWRGRQGTNLGHALAWATAAWGAWCGVSVAEVMGIEVTREARHAALCLSACVGVAVLEPRRPGVGPWHFVTGGLLVVLLLPQAEGWGRLQLRTEWSAFLAIILGVGLLNYLPTQLAFAVGLLALSLGTEWCALLNPEALDVLVRSKAIPLPLSLAPWAAWIGLRRSSNASPLDATWRQFRDRFGGLWALRIREQFNRAAEHARWDFRLGWQGAYPPDDPRIADEGLKTLRLLLRRFGPVTPEECAEASPRESIPPAQ